MKIKKSLLYYLNVPYHVSNHIVGKHHTPTHRRIVGMFVMLIGVTLAHAAQHISNIIISMFGDLVGYSIHGTGLIPFIHDIENQNKEQKQKGEQNNICTTC